MLRFVAITFAAMGLSSLAGFALSWTHWSLSAQTHRSAMVERLSVTSITPVSDRIDQQVGIADWVTPVQGQMLVSVTKDTLGVIPSVESSLEEAELLSALQSPTGTLRGIETDQQGLRGQDGGDSADPFVAPRPLISEPRLLPVRPSVSADLIAGPVVPKPRYMIGVFR